MFKKEEILKFGTFACVNAECSAYLMELVRNILHSTGVETEAGQTDLHNTHYQNPLKLEHNALHNTDENDLGCEQFLHSIPATN